MGERAVIEFADVYNFRDLGGHTNSDGKVVVAQRLYRSDDLGRLHEDEREAFTALGIRTVVDLRRPHEIEELGRFPQWDGVSYHHVHLAHPMWPTQTFTDNDARTLFVVERYREMSIEAAGGFGQALRLIADAGNSPLVFHCIAGKDRTGILAALTLSLLGVDDEAIADDYARSEEAEEQAWAYYARKQPGIVRPANIVISPRPAMLTFLTDLRQRHGSVEGYAASIGVSGAHIDAMRAHLLTP